MKTYVGVIHDWFGELGNYRLNNLVEPKSANQKGVKYAVYEWKYASRVLVLDINETVRIFYRIDFPAWIEIICYILGLISYAIVVAAVFMIAHAHPGLKSLAGMIAFMCFNLLAMMVSDCPDIFPAIAAMAMEYFADKMYWKHSVRRSEQFNFQVIHDKNRCRYFAWTLINVHGGNKQLRMSMNESNRIMKELGLEFQTQM